MKACNLQFQHTEDYPTTFQKKKDRSPTKNQNQNGFRLIASNIINMVVENFYLEFCPQPKDQPSVRVE